MLKLRHINIVLGSQKVGWFNIRALTVYAFPPRSMTYSTHQKVTQIFFTDLIVREIHNLLLSLGSFAESLSTPALIRGTPPKTI